MYATLRPTDEECDQPHISSTVPFEDTLVPELDDIAKNMVDPQFRVKLKLVTSEGNDWLSAKENDE